MQKDQQLYTTEEFKQILKDHPHDFFLVAGEENLLDKLPQGNWVAGTTAYFMTSQGATSQQNKIFVIKMPSLVKAEKINLLNSSNLNQIYLELSENSFGYLIIPAGSESHKSFALHATHYSHFASQPLVGWISGVHMSDLNILKPAVVNGLTLEKSYDEALYVQFSYPEEYFCDSGFVNLFTPQTENVLQFKQTGFSAETVLINNVEVNLSEYIEQNKIDIRFPLVTQELGANTNISFQQNDLKNKNVTFFAPVFEGKDYYFAKPVTNYIEEFKKVIPHKMNHVVFSCNCILNYLYSDLDGKSTGTMVGPISFGEIFYQLVNQTLVYLTLEKKD